MHVESLFDLDDVIESFIDFDPEFSDKRLAQLEHKEGGLHMLPGNIEMLRPNWHSFMKLLHDWSFVMVWPSKDVSQKQHHSWMQLGDVWDVLQEEVIDAIICQHELVELCHHLLEPVMSADLFKQRSHR